MSRIDEALRRLTGGVSPEPRKQPHSLDGFASEGEVSHKSDELRRQPRIEARKVASFVAGPPVSSPVEPVRSAAPTPVAAAKPGAEAALQRQLDRLIDRPDPEADVEKLIDVRQITDYAGFVLRSVPRHKMLAAGMFLGVAFLAALAAILFPRTYHVEVKLLAQRNAVMTALSNPGRAVPWDADAPTRSAAETVLRRDNLIDLIAKTDLINEWDRRRPVLVRVRDWVKAKVTGYELTPDDKLEALVYQLETYMIVEAGPVGDGTVTIELYWPDAEMAYRIVEQARQAFLTARQAAETSQISESIAILEDYSQKLHDNVQKTLNDMTRAGARSAPVEPVRASVAPRPRPTAPAFDPLALSSTTADAGVAPNPEVMRVATQLQAKQEELRRLESQRQSELSTAQARLAAFKQTYTAAHPSVQNEQAKVDALVAESSQLAGLQKQVDDLEARYEALSTADAERMEKENAKVRASAPTVRAAAPIARDQVIDAPAPTPRVNPAAEFANLTFRTELSQLQSILERTDGARIELAVSEAAFKYRYTVIKPAQIPREPQSPNLRFIALAGLLAAIALAVGAAVAKDLISNRIVEAWQVERQLGIPILGSVRL
jgi:uncharacterized protein involved in exopolysaccharide biosynthesis